MMSPCSTSHLLRGGLLYVDNEPNYQPLEGLVPRPYLIADLDFFDRHFAFRCLHGCTSSKAKVITPSACTSSTCTTSNVVKSRRKTTQKI